MRREVKALKSKAVNSLTLSIEHFNRPRDEGRVEAVLIFLDHSFEMLLKAAIVHRGGSIRDRGEQETIGFDKCVRRSLSEPEVSFLQNREALTLQTINGLRDATQHYLLDISEQNLYIHAQAGLTLFRSIYKKVFGENLYPELPKRVLPLSTTPPADLDAVFDNEVKEIYTLLRPGKRSMYQARAKLRTLAIIDKTLTGQYIQPSEYELSKLAKRVKNGENLETLFPGVASINITTKGYGPSIDLRFSTKTGIPIRVVPEGTPGAPVVGIKKVNELDFYNLSISELATKLDLTMPKAVAAVQAFGVKNDEECHKEIVIGKTRFHRYSPRAIDVMKEKLQGKSIDEIWRQYRASLVSKVGVK